MKIKAAHLGLGLDLLGSKTSLVADKRLRNEIDIWWEQDPNGAYHALGLIMTGGKSGRKVGVFFANLKGCELQVEPKALPTPVVPAFMPQTDEDPIITKAKLKKQAAEKSV